MRWNRALLIVVIVELVVAGVIVGSRISRPQFPVHVEKLLDPYTSESLQQLRASLSVDRPRDWYMLGDAYLAYGSYRQAEACFRRSTELDSESIDSRINWGIALARLGQANAASQQLRGIVESAPTVLRPEIWYRIGNNYLREEKVAEAEAAFERVPEFGPAAYQLARIQMRSGRAKQADQVIEYLLKDGANVMEINQLAAQCAGILGDEKRASHYAALTNLVPDRIALNRTVSLFKAARQRYGISKLLADAIALEDASKTAASADLLVKALDHEQSESVVAKIAELEIRLGRPQAAVKRIEEQFGRGGASSLLLERLGDAYLEMGQPDLAEQSWKHGLRLGQRQSLHEKLARLDDGQGDSASAQRHRGLAAHYEGLSLHHRNDQTAALTAFSKAAELVPNHAPSWFYLGQIHWLQGQSTKAREAYRRVLSIDPGHGRASAALSRLDGDG